VYSVGAEWSAEIQTRTRSGEAVMVGQNQV
jgi:hypothetical protein